jgi:hypothetical protein
MRALLALIVAGCLAAQQQESAPLAPAPGAKDEAAGAKLKAVIDAGHEWLKRHQDADGRWSAAAFVVHDPKGAPCLGAGQPDQDVFVTALVVVACHGLGQIGPQAPDHVQKAVAWLRAQQQEDGTIGQPGERMLARNTATASDALSNAGRYDNTDKKLPATTAWLLDHRTADGLWPAPDSAQPDWVTTTMALCHHVMVGQERVSDGVLAKLWQLGEKEPPHGPVAGAAFLAAWYVRDAEMRTRCCDLLGRTPPDVAIARDRRDYFAWYCTTQAMQFHDAETWDTWWRALVATATTLQRQDGSYAGSWDPDDVRGREGGRVYATAAMLLALEVAWRKEYRDK